MVALAHHFESRVCSHAHNAAASNAAASSLIPFARANCSEELPLGHKSDRPFVSVLPNSILHPAVVWRRKKLATHLESAFNESIFHLYQFLGGRKNPEGTGNAGNLPSAADA